MSLNTIFIAAAYFVSVFATNNQNVFPEDFLFGVSTSAYQIEGAWNADGKGENIWDRLTHTQVEVIDDQSNADVAANSYEFYEKDIEALKYLGVDYYRFSISWTRVLPTGEISSLSEIGIEYYSTLINRLIENGIEPLVTMYHWDLPQSLEILGGFTNPIILKYFEEYVRLLYDRFGDRVKYWITFNEPFGPCVIQYVMLPNTYAHGVGEYLCGHNVLLAHAKAYHIYQDEYKDRYGGSVGITLGSNWMYAKSSSKEDLAAQEKALQFSMGWFAHPVFSVEGGYPEVMMQSIFEKSLSEGRTWSRLPKMSEEDIAYIKGTSDFFGLNHYTSAMVTSKVTTNITSPSFFTDQDILHYTHPSWKPPYPDIDIYNVPEGIRKLCQWIKKEYDNPEIFITENGYPDHGEIADFNRVNYIIGYLKETLKAIYIDKCKIKLYTVWSLIDNFEWMRGYTQSFGLFTVNFTSTLKTRTPKLSATVFKDILRTRKLPRSVNKKECKNSGHQLTSLGIDDLKEKCYKFS